MKHEKLSQALNEISDTHIAEASVQKRKPRAAWISAVAAALALVILLHSSGLSLALQVEAISTANYPKYEWQYREEMDNVKARLADFFTSSMSQTLSDTDGKNQTYSPVNLYMAMALSAELTAGNTRQQILDAVGTNSMDLLRQQTNTLWNACYYDDKDQVLLANSVWLDQDLGYYQDTMDLLASNYYTSVYQGDFGSSSTNRAITTWLDQQTGGLLKDRTATINLDPETVLALYSTVYFQAMWTESSEFSSSRNTDGVFHAPGGDVDVTFMNKKEHETSYYWGEDFGAVSLGLRNGCRMWFILPDTDKTTDDVLCAQEYLPFILGLHECDGEECTGHRRAKVNLSVPKFDIQVNGDLKEDLQAMGITDLFTPGSADFSSSVESSKPVWATGVNQATRVAIDEEGVTAASYIELPAPGAAPPPDEIIDFVLDRPFLFVITNRYDVPLFAGIVNQP